MYRCIDRLQRHVADPVFLERSVLRGALAAVFGGCGLVLPVGLSATAARMRVLQGRLIYLVAFADVDRAPDISIEAGLE